MKGTTSFCFKANSPGKAPASFNVRFAAQRFAADKKYWSTQLDYGECSLGVFSFWGAKHIANLVVTKVTDPMKALSPLPLSTVDLFAQRADSEKTPLGTTLTFGYRDHYDNEIQIADVDGFYTGLVPYNVVISKCGLHENGRELSNTCTASTLAATANIVMGSQSAPSQKEGGVVTATLVKSSISLSSAVTYELVSEKWCLGCYLLFTIKSTTNSDCGRQNYSPHDRRAVARVRSERELSDSGS